MNSPVKNQKLMAVQIFRALGVSLIVFAHIAIAFVNSVYTNTEVTPDWIKYLYGCRSAIDMFFVFSGFIMVYIAHEGFAKKETPIKFLFFRLTRIVPIYWIYTLLALFFGFLIQNSNLQEGIGVQSPSFETFWKSFLFIPYVNTLLPIANVDGIMAYPALVVGWTLNYEIFFYILFAFCMRFSLFKGLLTLSGITVMLTVAHQFCPTTLVPLYFWTSPILWKFIIGTWIGYLFSKNIRFNKIPFWLAALFCVIAFMGLFFLYVDYAHTDNLFFNVSSGLLATFLTAGIALTKLEHATAPDWVIKIGDASYSTYLSHFFVVAMTFAPLYVFTNPSPLAGLLVGGVVFIFALYCGHMSYTKLELPLMNFFRQRYKQKKLEKENAQTLN